MITGAESEYRPFRDPNNGLEGIFRFSTGRLEYTLVKVPADVPFVMEYERVMAETDLQLEPIGGKNAHWRVTGTVDTNTYAQLGLPIHRERRIAQLGGKLSDAEGEGENGPTVLPSNLRTAREFGQIEELGYGIAAGTEMYKVTLDLPPSRVTAFLRKIWVPDLAPKLKIVTGNEINQERVLPQKYPLRPSSAPLTRLLILRA